MRAAFLALALVLLLGAAALVGETAGTFSDQAQVGANALSTADCFLYGGIACEAFESGGWSGGVGWLWGWWYQGDSAITTSGTSHGGAYHLRLRSNTGYVDRALDLSGQSNVHLQFWAKVNSLEVPEYVELLVGPSGSMTVARTWTNTDDDNIYHFEDIDLSPYAMSSEFYIAFDAEMSGTGDYFYVDDMLLEVVPP
jgi:hypothetical protein